MPAIPGFIDTLDKIKKLHQSKNEDYSGDKGPFYNFAFCEAISSLFSNSIDKVFAVFVAVKIARLSVLLSADKVNNESVEDSFDDFICYSTIWKSHYLARKKAIDYNKVDEVTVREKK